MNKADAPAQVEAKSRLQVSIIINTDGRAERLVAALESLRQLDYPDFEVCVVYGPTPDGTQELLESWADRIKLAHCPTRNLSQSRNIGLALSAGEIVAFLDDDSIPEPEWLTKVVAPFVDPDVAACGGFLLDHTGVSYQWRFGTANRMGLADTSWERASPELNFPYTANFPHVMANSAFRLSAVIAVGGFDEQYIYFLDETDLICRLVDHGYRIVQLEGAPVHHKYAASHIRTEDRLLTAWYAVIRSKIYFSLVNAHSHHDAIAAIKDAQAFVSEFENVLEWAISVGKLSPDLRKRFKEDVDQAFRSGLAEGLSANRLFYDAAALAHHASAFHPFSILLPLGLRRTICLLTQTYPPASIGGVGRYIHQLARSIAALGHQVHVLTRVSEQDTVDLEDGVWVHRLTPKRHLHGDRTRTMPIPDHIWDHAATMRDELRKIARERDIDVVYAPIWDCEGIAILLSGEFKLVTSLQTTLTFWLDSHEHMRADQTFMDAFATPMLAVEHYLLKNSAGIHAISAGIAREIENAYGIDFGRTHMAVVPLGQEDWSTFSYKSPEPLPEGTVRLLFVGRLEARKGIDILMQALPDILTAHPELHVDVVGNDRLLSGQGATYRQLFEMAHAGDALLSRIRFHGEVDEEALRGFYKACDLFVAPSRFESFGLILLEAMMFGKPVIACRAGGMVEVVADGVSGLLAEPGDALSLTTAIVALVSRADLRARMGRAARERYEARFTQTRMAEGVLELLAEVADTPSRSESALEHVGGQSECSQSEHELVKASRGLSSPPKVALINSIVAFNDAISASVLDTYRALTENGAYQVSLFCYKNDCTQIPSQTVSSVAELLLHREYLDADVLIWHFGIYYELFNAARVGNGRASQVVCFHNVTPKKFTPMRSWQTIDCSLIQCHLLRHVDEVWADSGVNAAVARDVGVDLSKVYTIPLAVEGDAVGSLVDKALEPVVILFVGRFVPSKGVLELLRAVEGLSKKGTSVPIKVELVGNVDFSDPDYVDEVRAFIVKHALSDFVTMRGTVDNATLQDLYRGAHVLAIPSYHEGFCKPVIEALRAGCIPVGYAAYNLPYITNGFGRLVPPGDVDGLGTALRDIVETLPGAMRSPQAARLPLDMGNVSVASLTTGIRRYVEEFSAERIGAKTRKRLHELIAAKAP